MSATRKLAARIPAWWWAVTLTVVIASWWIVLGQGQPAVSPGTLIRDGLAFVDRLLGGSEATPAWAQGSAWRAILPPAGATLAMSVLGAAMAGVAAILIVPFAARTLTAGWMVNGLARGTLAVLRAVPDLLWALVLVFIFERGVLVGALALAAHNTGVLGRLGADVVEDLDQRPLRALRGGGASHLQVLAYGILPGALPQLLTFLFYRWEVMIRAAAVVGFVTQVGIGYRLRLDLSFFRWPDIALALTIYVLLVLAVDAMSALLRRLAN